MKQVFAFIMFFIPVMAFAQVPGSWSAVQLQQLCNSRYDVDTGMCAGYVMAVADKLMHDRKPISRVCLSPAIGPQVLVDNLKRSWEEAPPAAQDLAVDNVEGVLRTRFRCID